MEEISKSFPGVKALDKVNLELDVGEVLALLGENGAGKSTLIKILGGIYNKDTGKIFLNGEKIEINSPKQSQEYGIGIIHQDLSLLPHLSVMENIFLGREKVNQFNKINWNHMKNESIGILSKLGVTNIDVTKPVNEYSIAIGQMVEIARVLSMDCKIIVMDEPTDTLTYQETEFLFNVIQTLKKEGRGIIYISHKIDEIFQIADRVEVLRDGKYIGTVKAAKTTADDLIQMMVGRKLEDKFPRVLKDPGKKVMEIVNLEVPGVLEDINFELYSGEVLGFSGLVGAGRSELAKSIFGVYKHSGQVLLEGKSVEIKNPKDALELGIAYLTEDRKQEALFFEQEVSFNITVASLKDFIMSFGRLSKSKETEKVGQYVEKLKIKTPSIHEIVNNLSGGNQQKLLLARWMMTNPKVLILDEPTRGVDVGAKVEIYNIINQLKKNDVGIIVISSELPEILGICDRIIVMHNGRIAGEFTHENATQEKIIKCAVNV
jgi:ABC-type sugar transport system ATPase subunit